MANLGAKLNEVSNWEDWRLYEEESALGDISKGKLADANWFEGNQTFWVEAVTHANLPTGMTQGFITCVEASDINGTVRRGQTAVGEGAAIAARYFDGGWSAWA